MNIVDHYLINSQTMLLLPGKSVDYETIILEENRIVYARCSMFQIIEESCRQIGFTSYQARKEIISQITGFQRKTPIFIREGDGTSFFRIHAINHLDNYWFSTKHILAVKRLKNKRQCLVHFVNGQTLIVPYTYVSFMNLYQRAMEVQGIVNAIKHKS